MTTSKVCWGQVVLSVETYLKDDKFTPGDAEACDVHFISFMGKVGIVACDLM